MKGRILFLNTGTVNCFLQFHPTTEPCEIKFDFDFILFPREHILKKKMYSLNSVYSELSTVSHFG